MIRMIFPLIVFLLPSPALATTPAEISSALRKDLVHPYLYFTSSEKPAIFARIRSDLGQRAQMEHTRWHTQ